MTASNAVRLKKVLQTVKLDENTSTVMQVTVPVRKCKVSKIHGFTDAQRAKSIATKKASSLQTRNEALVVFRSKHFNVGKTCEAMGITRTTWHTWLEKFPEFKQSVSDSLESRLDQAEESLDTAVKMLDVPAIKYILDKKGGSRGYGEKTEGPQTQIAIVWQTPQPA